MPSVGCLRFHSIVRIHNALSAVVFCKGPDMASCFVTYLQLEQSIVTSLVRAYYHVVHSLRFSIVFYHLTTFKRKGLSQCCVFAEQAMLNAHNLLRTNVVVPPDNCQLLPPTIARARMSPVVMKQKQNI